MQDAQRSYIAIDLKSFYASVECVDRGLDPLTTNLVVADISRTEKTICLAVSPSMKAYGIGGRARLFEVVQRMREVNNQRQWQAPQHRLTGKSYNDMELKTHPDWAVDYIAAPPRMAHYIEVSSRVYSVYLKYIAPEDIHVYSIDEVFMDVTNYLRTYDTMGKIARLDKERRLQEAQLKIKHRFGKNAILRGLNYEEGATAKDRNKQIGGHKA